MNLKYLSSQVELGFWHLTIGLMSDSPTFQSVARWIIQRVPFEEADFGGRFFPGKYSAHNVIPLTLDPARVVLWAAAGWLMGFLLGFILAIRL